MASVYGAVAVFFFRIINAVLYICIYYYICNIIYLYLVHTHVCVFRPSRVHSLALWRYGGIVFSCSFHMRYCVHIYYYMCSIIFFFSYISTFVCFEQVERMASLYGTAAVLYLFLNYLCGVIFFFWIAYTVLHTFFYYFFLSHTYVCVFRPSRADSLLHGAVAVLYLFF